MIKDEVDQWLQIFENVIDVRFVMQRVDDRFGKWWVIKYYRDVDGVKRTGSINDLGIESNKNEIVPIIDHIGTRALRIDSNSE